MSEKSRETEKTNGFTLIEVLIAIFILTVGILAVAAMQIASIQGNATAASVTEAINTGTSEIEGLLQQGLNSYNGTGMLDRNNDGVAGLNNATAATADYNTVYGRYTVYWNVALDELFLSTKTIRIIIAWNDRGSLKSTMLNYIIPEII